MPKRKPGRPRTRKDKNAPVLVLKWQGQYYDPPELINQIVAARKASGESVTAAKADIAAQFGVHNASLYQWLRRESTFPRDAKKLKQLLELHHQYVTSDKSGISEN